jgi:hypothetical protein
MKINPQIAQIFFTKWAQGAIRGHPPNLRSIFTAVNMNGVHLKQ